MWRSELAEISIVVTETDLVARGRGEAQAVPYLVGQEPVKGASFIHMTFLKIVWKRKVLVKSSVCCEKMEGDEEEKSLCSW